MVTKQNENEKDFNLVMDIIANDQSDQAKMASLVALGRQGNLYVDLAFLNEKSDTFSKEYNLGFGVENKATVDLYLLSLAACDAVVKRSEQLEKHLDVENQTTQSSQSTKTSESTLASSMGIFKKVAPTSPTINDGEKQNHANSKSISL